MAELDINEVIDKIANSRTENAERSDLEEYFYNAQYAELEGMTDDEVIQIHNDMFGEE